MIQINSHTAERNNQRNATICPDFNFFCHLKCQACSLKHVWFKLFSVNRVACSLVTVIAQAQKDVSRSSSDIVRYFPDTALANVGDRQEVSIFQRHISG